MPGRSIRSKSRALQLPRLSAEAGRTGLPECTLQFIEQCRQLNRLGHYDETGVLRLADFACIPGDQNDGQGYMTTAILVGCELDAVRRDQARQQIRVQKLYE